MKVTVELPRVRVELPRAGVELPRVRVELPRAGVDSCLVATESSPGAVRRGNETRINVPLDAGAAARGGPRSTHRHGVPRKECC